MVYLSLHIGELNLVVCIDYEFTSELVNQVTVLRQMVPVRSVTVSFAAKGSLVQITSNCERLLVFRCLLAKSTRFISTLVLLLAASS